MHNVALALLLTTFYIYSVQGVVEYQFYYTADDGSCVEVNERDCFKCNKEHYFIDCLLGEDNQKKCLSFFNNIAQYYCVGNYLGTPILQGTCEDLEEDLTPCQIRYTTVERSSAPFYIFLSIMIAIGCFVVGMGIIIFRKREQIISHCRRKKFSLSDVNMHTVELEPTVELQNDVVVDIAV